MNDFRKRIQIQKRKEETSKPSPDKTEIRDLNHRLDMYRKIIGSFEPLSSEWIVCKEDMMRIIRRLSELGVEVIKIDG